MTEPRRKSTIETMTDSATAAELTLPAPAKLNRMLHVVGRRADGYHELQTLFQFLDHGDTLHLRLRDDGEIRLTPALPGVPVDRLSGGTPTRADGRRCRPRSAPPRAWATCNSRRWSRR